MSGPVWTIGAADRDFPACLLELGTRTPPVLYGSETASWSARSIPTGPSRLSVRAAPAGMGSASPRSSAGAEPPAWWSWSGWHWGMIPRRMRGRSPREGPPWRSGNGPDSYPRSKADLYRRIVRAGGAVIAEQPPGREPEPRFFPARNRIMAALGGVVVIVEGRHRPAPARPPRRQRGSAATSARCPERLPQRCRSLNDLIRDGAALIRDAQDLLDVGLGIGGGERAWRRPRARRGPRAGSVRRRGGAATCDHVALELGADGRDAAVALARLELMGYVTADASGRYARSSLAAPE